MTFKAIYFLFFIEVKCPKTEGSVACHTNLKSCPQKDDTKAISLGNPEEGQQQSPCTQRERPPPRGMECYPNSLVREQNPVLRTGECIRTWTYKLWMKDTRRCVLKTKTTHRKGGGEKRPSA